MNVHKALQHAAREILMLEERLPCVMAVASVTGPRMLLLVPGGTLIFEPKTWEPEYDNDEEFFSQFSFPAAALAILYDKSAPIPTLPIGVPAVLESIDDRMTAHCEGGDQ